MASRVAREDVEPVDLGGGHRAGRPAHGAGADRREDRLASGRRETLGVVEVVQADESPARPAGSPPRPRRARPSSRGRPRRRPRPRAGPAGSTPSRSRPGVRSGRPRPLLAPRLADPRLAAALGAQVVQLGAPDAAALDDRGSSRRSATRAGRRAPRRCRRSSCARSSNARSPSPAGRSPRPRSSAGGSCCLPGSARPRRWCPRC